MAYKLLLDDRLYPIGDPRVLRGKYRGRKKRIFVYRKPNESITRTVVSLRGWHRAVVRVGEHEYYRSRATRDKAQAWALAESLYVEERE